MGYVAWLGRYGLETADRLKWAEQQAMRAEGKLNRQLLNLCMDFSAHIHEDNKLVPTPEVHGADASERMLPLCRLECSTPTCSERLEKDSLATLDGQQDPSELWISSGVQTACVT